MRRNLLFLIQAACLMTAAVFSAAAQSEVSIAAIQGAKARSPLENQVVKTTGIVTARDDNGYFMQTPDEKTDKDPATSEAIYVFVGQNGTFTGAVGDLVETTGTVVEFMPRAEKLGFTVTELTKATTRIVSSKNALPAPVTLTTAELLPNDLSALERFEGMRVRADSLTVTQATAPEPGRGKNVSQGVFFATLSGVPRPMREPGLDVFVHQAMKPAGGVQWFDTNPEMIRVNTDALLGTKPIIVTAGATVKNVVGVMHYNYRRYTIMLDPDAKPVVEGMRSFTAVPAAGERELSVSAFNIENFFDDERNSDNVEKEEVLSKEVFQKRLNKASLAIRKVLLMPDVLGVEEVENLKVLKKLAAKINADAVASGLPDPKYEAYLEEGNDIRGIDSGYLIRSTRVKVLETKQLAKDQQITAPGATGNLFDRPPYLIRVQAIDAKSTDPLTLTVIVNHFKSYGGIEEPRTQIKRAEEANWLASFVAERAKTNPDERVAVCGDFNAFVVNDGYNDLIGTLLGTPDQNVIVPGKPFVTNLIDLAMLRTLPMAERYSYVFDGSAQVLDHMLINKKLAERFVKFAYARLDADFPVSWAEDDSRPERLSDHDPPVVYFSLDPKAPAGPAKPSATPAAKAN